MNVVVFGALLMIELIEIVSNDELFGIFVVVPSVIWSLKSKNLINVHKLVVYPFRTRN